MIMIVSMVASAYYMNMTVPIFLHVTVKINGWVNFARRNAW